MSQIENQYKIIVIGDTGTGKSSLIVKFTDGAFTDSFNSTIGVDFRTRAFDVTDQKVRLYIWDTAGQERFKSITRSYYNTTEGIILAFDLTNKETFITLPLWMEDFENYGVTKCPVILVGTKSDKHPRKQVESKEIYDFIESYNQKFNIQYVETSAKYGRNIEEVFLKLGEELLKIKSVVPKMDTKTVTLEKSMVSRGQDSLDDCRQDTCCLIL